MALQTYEIPLAQGPQRFSVDILGTTYYMRLYYREDPGPGWVMDVESPEGVYVATGLALTTGTDLFAPFPYLRVGARLYALMDGDDMFATPGYTDMGTHLHLYYEYDDGV